MLKRLVADVAICATVAQAVSTEKAYRSGRWAKPAHLVEQEAIAENPYDGAAMNIDDGHTCSYAHDRTKKPITTDLNKWLNGGMKWTDNDFIVEDAIYWSDVPFEDRSLVAA